VDADDRPEILLALEDCSLQCLSGDGQERFRFRPKQEKVIAPSNTWLHKNSAQRVWVVDGAGASGKTIVVSTGDQCVHGLDGKGQRLWHASSRPGVATILATSDVNGDGRPEMLIGNRDVCTIGILKILNGKDQPLAEFDPRTGATINAIAVVDLDGDGREEVFVATISLACLDPRTMKVRWAHGFGDEVRGVVAVRGPNGAPMVVAGSRNEFVVAFNAAGQRQWAAHAGVPVEFLVALRRGQEVLVAAMGATGRVVVFDTAGELRYQCELGAVPQSVVVPKACPELLCVATADGRVTALRLSAGK
jgi:outer membrane protein assembly factor BamB